MTAFKNGLWNLWKILLSKEVLNIRNYYLKVLKIGIKIMGRWWQ